MVRCYSNVGRMGSMQIVSLGLGCHFVGTVVHELGHVVGFFHEHQRSDRDKFIFIETDNVMPDSIDQFDKMNLLENRILVPYDYYSVLHYGSSAFSKRPGLVTMKPKTPGVTLLEVYQKYGLSEADILSVNKLYKCI